MYCVCVVSKITQSHGIIQVKPYVGRPDYRANLAMQAELAEQRAAAAKMVRMVGKCPMKANPTRSDVVNQKKCAKAAACAVPFFQKTPNDIAKCAATEFFLEAEMEDVRPCRAN